MMKKVSVLSIGGIIVGVACLICSLLNYHIIAASVGLLAFFLCAFAVKNDASLWKVYSFIAVAAIFGYSLSPAGGYYTFTFVFLFLSLMTSARLLLFKSIAHNELPWLEFLWYGLALILYIVACKFDSLGWINCLFAIPAFIWATYMAIGYSIDVKEFKIVLKHRFGVQPGNSAPVFTLIDQDGNEVCLSDYKNKQHVLLIFVRGDWCPTCHIMLRTYEKYKAKFAEKNIAVLAIGPDPTGVNKAMVERLGLDYKVLSDSKNEAAKAFGMIFQSNKPMAKYDEGVPLPAAFLIDIFGKVVYTTNPKKPGEILKPDTIFPVVEKLQIV